MTQLIPMEQKAEMLELEIREYIKNADLPFFGDSETHVAADNEGALHVVVFYKKGLFYKADYPDVPNLTILAEFAHYFKENYRKVF